MTMMTQTWPMRHWPMKALSDMTAEELLAALERLSAAAPNDAALAKALRGELVRAALEEEAGVTPDRSGSLPASAPRPGSRPRTRPGTAGTG
ncbi:hypothetical protein [Nocardiopsis composta]|uniref:Uncharacterized protein n=1 Tax=Nocardiopsis composta TaxID=157465 RepID=A0A7W8QQC3_9ACTN|nr:hypothetical protein [Nocardiopsis composta]MBB5433671.1 hypothetical protein [Nocardiopsis composta]